MWKTALSNLRVTGALVHNITNYVTVNDCANAILAVGGSPIMADDLAEVEEIISLCGALVINIGTLNARTIESMILAGKKANELSKPVILDPVGAGASKLRTETVYRLLDEVKFSVIRGNISEIKTVYAGTGTTQGVDADLKDALCEENKEEVISFAKVLSQKTGAVIAITGKTDLIADEHTAYLVKNGHETMSKITGTGCMLSAILGAFVGANNENVLNATTAAVSFMGQCGEYAHEKMLSTGGGTSSFRTYLIDAMSLMSVEDFERGARIENAL